MVLNVGLFIPCYIDQVYPNVGIATLQLLEKFGCKVLFPLNQTCCGQPLANSGFVRFSRGCDKNFVANFSNFDYIVSPSGSCILHIKEHLRDEENNEAVNHIRSSSYELTEFMTDILKIESLDSNFPYKVGLHNGCHGLRGLHLSSMTELHTESFSKPEKLLKMVKGLQLTKPPRTDECCGFGGTFCVFEEAVSVKMGKDTISGHQLNDVQFITSADTSCLMHLDGILRRMNSPIKTVHIAEILNSSIAM